MERFYINLLSNKFLFLFVSFLIMCLKRIRYFTPSRTESKDTIQQDVDKVTLVEVSLVYNSKINIKTFKVRVKERKSNYNISRWFPLSLTYFRLNFIRYRVCFIKFSSESLTKRIYIVACELTEDGELHVERDNFG